MTTNNMTSKPTNPSKEHLKLGIAVGLAAVFAVVLIDPFAADSQSTPANTRAAAEPAAGVTSKATPDSSLPPARMPSIDLEILLANNPFPKIAESNQPAQPAVRSTASAATSAPTERTTEVRRISAEELDLQAISAGKRSAVLINGEIFEEHAVLSNGWRVVEIGVGEVVLEAPRR